MSDARVNALIEAQPRLAFGLTIYEYITSLIVVRLRLPFARVGLTWH